MIARVLALLLVLSGVAEAARTHVVAIGNDRGRADEVPLRFAERDAQALADIMRRLGGVRPQDLVVVNGGNASDVRRTLLEVNTRIRPQSAQSALIVYYSGHADGAGLVVVVQRCCQSHGRYGTKSPQRQQTTVST